MDFKSMTLVVLMLLFAPALMHAQTATGTDQAPANDGKAKAGTYQIVITKTKQTPVFTDDLLFTIEQKRDDNEIVYYDVQPGVRVTILPRKTINDPAFVPLEEVVYE